MADLSRVRNAIRDTGESMRRFEKNYERFQREAKAALAAGATNGEVTAAVNEGLRGHPDLQQRIATLVSGLEKAEATNAQ